MPKLSFTFLITLIVATVACRDSSRALEQDASQATIASETGTSNPANAADVLVVSKALISGELYESPSFESTVITQFDTSQQLFLLDTTDIMFVKARLFKGNKAHTGFVSKAILPEKE